MTYETFADAFHAYNSQDPNANLWAGIPSRTAELPDPSCEAGARKVAAARALLADLEGVERSGLDFERRLDLELARKALTWDILWETHTWNGRTRRQQLPDAGDGLGDGLFALFVNDPRPADARLDDMVARLEAAPAYLQAVLARLDTPVARWVEIDLEKVGGLPELFETLRGWAAQEGYAGQDRLGAAIEGARAALDAYVVALRAMPTTTHIHLGPALTAEIVAKRGIEEPLEQLHAWARGFLAETDATVESLRGRLAARYGLPSDSTVEQVHEYLNKRFRVAMPNGSWQDILDRYQREHERLVDWIAERDLFPMFEGQELRIQQTPAFMAPTIPAGAMIPPPPFRTGTKTSHIYLTLSDDLLDEHNDLGIPGMMLHEGVPGHHLQLAWAAIHPSLIRRHSSNNDHAEGWTTMLEDWVLDQGYMGELVDEARFIGKLDIRRIGARVAIDLFLMSGDRRWLDVGVPCDTSSEDPFEAAGALLAAVTGFTPARVQAELNWYSLERGYPLSYLTGNRLVWKLKRDIEAHTGQRGLELDRLFHKTYLESGNMPVAWLRRVFVERGMLPDPHASTAPDRVECDPLNAGAA